MLVLSDERSHEFRLDEPHTQLIKEKSSLWADERKVSITHSTYRTGKNRHSGKRWYRWETDLAYGFFRASNGSPIPFYRARGKSGWRNNVPSTPFTMLNAYGAMPFYAGYQGQVKEVFGITELKDLYPIASMYNIDRYEGMPYGLRRGMRENEFKDFVASVYGKKKMRKDLVKAAAKVHPQVLVYTREFRNFVPIDWIVNFLRNNEDAHPGTFHTQRPMTRDLSRILSYMDPRSHRHLLNQEMVRNSGYIIDDILPRRGPIADFRNIDYNTLRDRVFRNWTEVHDHLLVNRRQVRFQWNEGGTVRTPPPKPEPVEIKLTEFASKIHNQTIDGLTYKCATSSTEMEEWSNEMHNCIRSYARMARDGMGVYVGVYLDDKIVANIEIDTSYAQVKLKQLLGKYNNTLDDTTRERVESFLRTLEVEIPNSYWGANNPANDEWEDAVYAQHPLPVGVQINAGNINPAVIQDNRVALPF